MSRREIREIIFKLLFRVEFHDNDEMQEQFDMIEDELGNISETDINYIKDKFSKIVENIDTIDAEINEKSQGWKTNRMGKVDLSIIRLAVYEIKFEDDIPVKVSIKEAVELAKKFGTDDSASFVNGVLAKFV